MRQFRVLCLILFFISTLYVKLPAQGIALCPPSTSKKALKLFAEAKAAKKSKEDYKTIKEILIETTEEDTAYAEPWLMLGDMAFAKKDYVTMKQAYIRLIAICPDADANAHYRL